MMIEWNNIVLHGYSPWPTQTRLTSVVVPRLMLSQCQWDISSVQYLDLDTMNITQVTFTYFRWWALTQQCWPSYFRVKPNTFETMNHWIKNWCSWSQEVQATLEKCSLNWYNLFILFTLRAFFKLIIGFLIEVSEQNLVWGESQIKARWCRNKRSYFVG